MKQTLLLLTVLGFISCDNTREPSAVEGRDVIRSESYIGVDLSDTLRSCVDKFDVLNCNEEFTDADAFALHCERDGKYAIQCGCHDWICVDSLRQEAADEY